jgi:hypothetical protein
MDIAGVLTSRLYKFDVTKVPAIKEGFCNWAVEYMISGEYNNYGITENGTITGKHYLEATIKALHNTRTVPGKGPQMIMFGLEHVGIYYDKNVYHFNSLPWQRHHAGPSIDLLRDINYEGPIYYTPIKILK